MSGRILIRRFSCGVYASQSVRRLRLTKSSCKQQKRNVVTESIEPPLDASVSERPCTVVLVENLGCYAESWQPTFSHILPRERGIHFCYASLDGSATSLATALSEMEYDLVPIPNAVLVARGPLWSWVSQYYLESFPLAGLVMVDPVIDLKTAVDARSQNYDLLCHEVEINDPRAHDVECTLLKRISTGQETRELKLEPGSVPMLLLHSVQDPGVVQAVHDTARRHTPEGFEDMVSVAGMTVSSVNDAATVICDWIDNQVI